MTKKILEEKLYNAIFYEKCLKCQCFKETLDTIKKQLYTVSDNESLSLLKKVVIVESHLLETQYT